jgi:3-oxoacyl-(acyl-carrier-protein) synthase
MRRLTGLPGIPDGELIGATVDLDPDIPRRLKIHSLCDRAGDEAVRDAAIDWDAIDRDRFGCAICAHMGDTGYLEQQYLPCDVPRVPWWQQWLPNSTCARMASRYDLRGPRTSHSTACASSLISFMSAVRSIRDGHCDIALTGGGDAIHPLFAAGFRQMRVLAWDEQPERACRPFDRNRCGFVMGEGAAVMVVERLSHALRRGARIYAEVKACQALAEAHHVTGLDADSETLSRLIDITLRRAGMRPADIGYINAHGTGTEQNDLVEMRAIRRMFGDCPNGLAVSSTKSILGHLINAAGGMELAITVLALRDGFAPPTLNLTDPDPECTFDCLPLVGRRSSFQAALKLSVAFGGHLVAVALQRWNDAATGYAYPPVTKAA